MRPAVSVSPRLRARRLEADESDVSVQIWAEVQRQGSLRFDRFVDLALYDPELGFYQRDGHSGGRGDFVTSPTVGALFGACVAAYLDSEWDRCGRPETWTLVDLGAGEGALTRSVVAAAPRCLHCLDVVLVERSASQRARHAGLIEWCAARSVSAASYAKWPSAPNDAQHMAAGSGGPDSRTVFGVVFGNEVLDNVPWRVMKWDSTGQLVEAFVSADRSLAWIAVPAEQVNSSVCSFETIGAEIAFPVQSAATELIDSWRARLGAGSVVMVDYGAATTLEIAQRDGWMRTYRRHIVGTEVMLNAGACDITCDVAFDQLPAGFDLWTQVDALDQWGIRERVARARSDVDRLAAAGGLDWVRARSTVSEANALTDPKGLGSFLVARWIEANRSHEAT